MLIAVP